MSGNAGGVEHHVGFEATLPFRRLDQEVKGSLRAQRMSGVVAAGHPGAPDRDDAVARPDPIREKRRSRHRLQHPLDHLGPRQEDVVGGKPAAEQLAEARRDVHPEGGEETRRAPSREGVPDLFPLEHGHVVTEPHEPECGGEPDRTGADDGNARLPHSARPQPLRVIVLQAWTQCAIVPPPRIAAATLTASAISSGLMPASAQADAYESMQ